MKADNMIYLLWESKIDCLDISKKIKYSLIKAGYYNVYKLLKTSDKDLLIIRGIGKKSVEDIRKALLEFLQTYNL